MLKQLLFVSLAILAISFGSAAAQAASTASEALAGGGVISSSAVPGAIVLGARRLASDGGGGGSDSGAPHMPEPSASLAFAIGTLMVGSALRRRRA